MSKRDRTNRLILTATVLILLPTCFYYPSADEPQQGTADDSILELPLTIEKVWYRTEKNRGIGKTYKMGDLVITPESIEFVHPKRGFKIAMDELRVVSLGKMRGDVDTEWVVISKVGEARSSLIALRDGRKMGFGANTAKIYKQLKEAARQAAAAQYSVPRGYVTYEALEHMFTIGVPETWSVFNRERVLVDGLTREGTVVFFETPASDDTSSLAEEIDAGRLMAFSLERREAGKGMTCTGLPTSFNSELREELFGGREVRGSQTVDRFELDGCIGVRVRGRYEEHQAGIRVVDVVAVAKDGLLYLFGIEVAESLYDSTLEVYEPALQTVRFNIAG